MKTRAHAGRKIRVLCVDDNDDVSAMIGRCVDAEPDMESAGSLRNADKLAADFGRTHPDVVLLDLGMPGADPLDALRDLSGAGGSIEDVRVIAFSGRRDHDLVARAIRAGAWGYITKDVETAGVLDAIREVARGRTVFGG